MISGYPRVDFQAINTRPYRLAVISVVPKRVFIGRDTPGVAVPHVQGLRRVLVAACHFNGHWRRA